MSIRAGACRCQPREAIGFASIILAEYSRSKSRQIARRKRPRTNMKNLNFWLDIAQAIGRQIVPLCVSKGREIAKQQLASSPY